MHIAQATTLNWGGLPNRDYPLGTYTLLAGESGSGKTHLIDAVVAVIGGGGSLKSKFNTAQSQPGQSSKKTQRTLASYVAGSEPLTRREQIVGRTAQRAACGTQARGGGGGGHGGGMGGFGGGHMGGFGGDHIGGFEGGRIGGLGGDHVGGLGGNHIAPLDHGHLGAGRRHFGGYYGYGFEYPYDPYDQSYNWQYTCSY